METELDEKLLKRPDYVGKVCGIVLNVLFAFIILVLIASLMTVLSHNLSVVKGDSMEGTLTDGQYVLCEKKPKIEKIGRGDIIVFDKDENTQYIKRVAAVGGDTVEFRKDTDGDGNETGTVTLYIQYGSAGAFVPQEENYIKEKMQVSYWTKHAWEISAKLNVPFRISDGCVFALGDNRNESLDSRYGEVGQVKAEAIVSRVKRVVPIGSFEEAYLGFIYGVSFKTTAGKI